MALNCMRGGGVKEVVHGASLVYSLWEIKSRAMPRQSGSGGSLIYIRNRLMLIETINSEAYVLACALGPHDKCRTFLCCFGAEASLLMLLFVGKTESSSYG